MKSFPALAARTLLAVLATFVLVSCSGTPASRDDYRRLYDQRCGHASFDNPTYCDR